MNNNNNNNKMYILFYSNNCLNCKKLFEFLEKDNPLNQLFTKVDVQQKNVKLPPYVKVIPSVLILENNKPLDFFKGNELFKWIEEMHLKNINSQEEIQEWDPSSMTGYSDGFSFLTESNDDFVHNNKIMKKSFSLMNENIYINTPEADNNSSQQNQNQNQHQQKYSNDDKKPKFDADYERFMNSRNTDPSIPKGNERT
jgi:thioredoxin-like negative regulator of GroEL